MFLVRFRVRDHSVEQSSDEDHSHIDGGLRCASPPPALQRPQLLEADECSGLVAAALARRLGKVSHGTRSPGHFMNVWQTQNGMYGIYRAKFSCSAELAQATQASQAFKSIAVVME